MSNDARASAIAVMHAHIDALNARDELALSATLHFPHYRLIDGALTVWETPETYFNDFRKRAGGQWSHSGLGPITAVHVSHDKVHLDVSIERFASDGVQIAAFPSLWVIAYLDGRWAAQLRSSFAPDEQIRAQ